MTSSSPTVSVVITNYETWPLTRKCIEAVRTHSAGEPEEIVVVDDASTTEPDRPLGPEVRIVTHETNRGYQASVNTGFAAAKGEIVLLLDSDAFPLMDLVAPAKREFGAQPRLGALGFLLVDSAGRPTGSSHPEPDALGLALGQQLEGRYVRWFRRRAAEAEPVLYSCAMAVRKEAFEAVGGFDEAFDFLDADVDFAMRLRRAGYLLRVDTTLRAIHEGSGSPQTTSRRVLRYHRNRWRLLRKHGRMPAPGLLKLALAARHAGELVLLRFGGSRLFPDRKARMDKIAGRRELLRTVWKGYGND